MSFNTWTLFWCLFSISFFLHCSIFKVHSRCVLLGASLLIISRKICFVKIFFRFFQIFFSLFAIASGSLSSACVIYHLRFRLSTLFYCFFRFFEKFLSYVNRLFFYVNQMAEYTLKSSLFRLFFIPYLHRRDHPASVIFAEESRNRISTASANKRSPKSEKE